MRRVDGSGLRKIRPEGEGFLSITTADFVGGKGISQQLSANLAPVQPFSTILRVAENPAESGRNLPTRRLLACQPESVRRLGELRPLLIHRRLDESMIPGSRDAR